MNISNHKHQALAELVAQHRKQFYLGLGIVVIAGGIFGYYASLFFAQFLVTDPDHPGFQMGTWPAMRKALLAIMAVFGMVMWPAIFAGFYFLWRRRSSAALDAKIAIHDEEARQARIAETEKKISKAKERGELNFRQDTE